MSRVENRTGDKKCTSMGIGTTWTARDIVILVRSLSGGTTRPCVLLHLSLRTGCTMHIRYAQIKQRFSCTSRVRQRQLAPPAGNMRINRRKIYTRNANIRALARVLSGPPQCCAKSMFFSCDHPVLSPANILIRFLSNKHKYVMCCAILYKLYSYLYFCGYMQSIFWFIQFHIYSLIFFKLKNVNRKM